MNKSIRLTDRHVWTMPLSVFCRLSGMKMNEGPLK